MSRKVADLQEFWRGQKRIILLDQNLLACSEKMELLEQLVDSHAQVEFNGGMDVRLLDEEILSALEKIKVKDYHFAWDDPRENLEEQFRLFRDAGLTGGLNFDAKNRRPSNTYEDMFKAYILGMDTWALGLMNAAKLIEDGRLDEFVRQRYASYNSGIGKKIVDGKTTLAELAAYADKLGSPSLPDSGNQEGLESIVNQVIFGR